MVTGGNALATPHLQVNWLELLEAGLPKRCCACFVQGYHLGADTIKVSQQLVLDELHSCKHI